MTGPDKRARLNFRFIAPQRPKLCPLAPMVRSALPPHIHKQLARIEPGAQFKGGLPQVLSSSGRSYYAKTGSQRDIGPYVTEVESLKAISLAAPGLVPTLLAFGFADEDGREADSSRGSPYFITEYKYMTPLTERSAAILGRRLATEMHNYTSPKGFGSEVQPYYGGVTRLRHGWYRTWERYVDALVGDLLSTLEARGGYSDLCQKGQAIRARWVSSIPSVTTAQVSKRVIPALLRPLRIRPVLLHGGLWVRRLAYVTSSYRCWYRAGMLEPIRQLASPLYLMHHVSTGTARPSKCLGNTCCVSHY